MVEERRIDGVAPERWLRPESAEDVANAVKDADATGKWVLPVGGGTSATALSPVENIPVGLDLTGVTGILEYEPTDLTVSVSAGTPWSELQSALAREGQTIPVDVPSARSATVGGVVATGYAGPRRLRDGSLKDLLLGASFVRGDGLVAKAGGMVVKNVTGFEIPRLLHGSWGSLAVLTSVNLKVVPLHEFEVTLRTNDLDTVDAADQMLALTGARSAIAAGVIEGTLERASGAVRLTGREQPTRDLAEEVRSSMALPWTDISIEADDSEGWWQEREDAHAAYQETRVSLQIGCVPSNVVAMIRRLRTAISDPSSVEVGASPGIGEITLAFDADAISLEGWRRMWQEHGFASDARASLQSAPRAWREAGDIWFIPEAQRRIMASLKSTFDPNDTLNRGRLWAGPLPTRI